MSELIDSVDAPPPPPPPPPDIEAKEPTPDASPELEKALQDGGQSGAQDDVARMARAQEQAADVKPQVEPYQQEPVDVPDGSNVTPNDTPGANRPVGSDAGTSDGPPDMDRALGQADPIRGDLSDFRQEPREVPVGSDVTPDPTPSGPPDVSPELAEALPQESEPFTASDATSDQETAQESGGPDDAPVTPDSLQEPQRAGADSGETGLGQPEANAEQQPETAEGPNTAQAAPAESEPAGGSADVPSASRPDIASLYPADYVPSADPLPSVEGPHESPEQSAADVNPDRDGPGRDNNCGECARAFDNTWHGNPAAAAAMSNADAAGEPVSRMTEWAGQAPTEASMPDVQQRLEELGLGSSAVVGVDWKDGGGHWFNAVNDGGTIKAVDGQSGLTEKWPPSDNGLGFNETDMSNSDAIFFTADGKVVR
jgi:Papain fold toxin 1, glutamine deamidase